jgi:hypothetical protein
VALTLEGDSSLAKLFTVERILQDRLARTDIGQYDVVLLANPGAIPAREGSRLAAAVKSGVGLVLFPGRSTVAASINTSLLAVANIPPSRPPRPANSSPQSAAGFLSFGAVDFSSPFAGMPTRRAAGRSARRTPHDGRSGVQSGRLGKTVIAMSDGRPFLCDYTNGNGHVLAFAVDADTMMSDFPFKGSSHRCCTAP